MIPSSQLLVLHRLWEQRLFLLVSDCIHTDSPERHLTVDRASDAIYGREWSCSHYTRQHLQARSMREGFQPRWIYAGPIYFSSVSSFL